MHYTKPTTLYPLEEGKPPVEETTLDVSEARTKQDTMASAHQYLNLVETLRGEDTDDFQDFLSCVRMASAP